MITLKTLHLATAQEVFDQVANHLLTQNEKSIFGGSNCKYRLGNLKCAAGCLISDEEYSEDIEGCAWSTLANREWAPKAHQNLIYDLQNLHDEADVVNWKTGLYHISLKHELEFNV